MHGLVIKNTGSWYTVYTDDGQLIDSKIKGNFRLKGIRSTNPVAVGDFVEITCNQEGTAFITAIDDRRNYIIRKSSNLSKQSHIIAANVDQAFLVVTVNYPETSTKFIDRFLASAEAYRVPVVLVFNKCDLLSAEELHYQEMMMQLYDTIGYQCVLEKAKHNLDHGVNNESLIGLSRLQDSLTYFNTSIRGNENLLQKLKFKLQVDELDADLIEDVNIEMSQAKETTGIYSDILESTMDTYSSIINNNMNTVMRTLTSVSIIMMFPTLIASLFGMNLVNGMENSRFGFFIALVISIIVSGLSWSLLRYKRLV